MYRWFNSRWLSHHSAFFMEYFVYELCFVPLAPFGSLGVPLGCPWGALGLPCEWPIKSGFSVVWWKNDLPRFVGKSRDLDVWICGKRSQAHFKISILTFWNVDIFGKCRKIDYRSPPQPRAGPGQCKGYVSCMYTDIISYYPRSSDIILCHPMFFFLGLTSTFFHSRYHA